MSNNLVAPWKIPFNYNGAGPYAVKVLLSDLIFDKSNGPDPIDWVPHSTGKSGFRLPHDILAYKSTIYSATSATLKVDSDGGSESERKKFGVFLTKVAYAPSEKASYVVDNESYSGGTYNIYNSDYSIPLTESYLADRSNTFLFGTGYTGSITVGVDNVADNDTANLPVFQFCDTDSTVASTLPGNQVAPYTAVRLNRIDSNGSPTADSVNVNLIEIIRFFTLYGVPGNDGYYDGVLLQGVDEANTLDPVANPALQTVEVWLTCGWLGDYVDPKSWNQELNPEANVQHKQLIVGEGDFLKYDIDAESNVHPYIPNTVPAEDLLKALAEEDTGSLAIPVGENLQGPIGWYDRSKDDNQEPNIKVPLSGNIYTDGRIISPTIDELWSYLKKLVSGRDTDVDTDREGTYPVSEDETFQAFDTRLAEEILYDLGNNRKGDPLLRDHSISTSKADGIKYNLHPNLSSVSARYGDNIDEFFPYIEVPEASSNLTDNDLRISTGELQTNELWGLRDKPLSLRELEAAIKDQQFNLQTIFNYLLVTKVSKSAEQDRGGLDQLHAEHQPNANNTSNTIWEDAEDTEKSYSIGDIDIGYGTVLPSSDGTDGFEAGQYDKNTHQDVSDIYMSPEGKWRYLFDHVRIPIVDDEF